jgi:hypothetical protein
MSPIQLGLGDLLAALGELDCARAAPVYAALGFQVVPMHTARPGDGCSCADSGCSDPGKHPRLRGWQWLATTDPAMVGEWWRRWPQANLGLVTGQRFDVLDVDGEPGLKALRAVLSIAPTEHAGPVARTGGGGWHLLYAPTGLGNRVRLLPGVDWRGRGGLIVAPPSQHASGHRYTWVRPLTATLLRSRPGCGACWPCRPLSGPPSPQHSRPAGTRAVTGGQPWAGSEPPSRPPSQAAATPP